MDEQRCDILSSSNTNFEREQFLIKNRTKFSLSFIQVPKQFSGEVLPRENLAEEEPFFGQANSESTFLKTPSNPDQKSDKIKRQINNFQHYLEDEDEPTNKLFSLNFVENAPVSSKDQFGITISYSKINQFADFDENLMNMPTEYTERNQWKQTSWNLIFGEEKKEMSSQETLSTVRTQQDLQKFQGSVATSGYNQFDEACLICGSKTGKHIHYGGHSCYSWCPFHRPFKCRQKVIPF